MSKNTNWNIDYYKTEHESEEHWNLRKKFMEVHKDKFDEDEIVCLAQVFTNVEFMGCKYPEETMRLVGELSQEIAKEFRAERSKKLKRTFVKASDAAEAKAKLRRVQNQNKTKQNFEKCSSQSVPNYEILNANLMKNMKYGNFVVYLIGGRNCLQVSAARCKMKYTERESLVNGKQQVEVIIGNTVVGMAQNTSIKLAKAEAFEAAINELRKHCYFIKINPNANSVTINKLDDQITANVKQSQLTEKKIDSNNIGYKMMKLMGWSGSGLGSQTQGREEPVGYLLKANRSGLGAQNKINRQYFQSILNNYLNSDDVRDLNFEPTFTKEDRATLHEIAGKMNLKSSSHGKGEARSLVISKKTISHEQILQEVLINQTPNFCNKYFIQVPPNKAQEFPMHTDELSL